MDGHLGCGECTPKSTTLANNQLAMAGCRLLQRKIAGLWAIDFWGINISFERSV
jgi:hypothetical protein